MTEEEPHQGLQHDRENDDGPSSDSHAAQKFLFFLHLQIIWETSTSLKWSRASYRRFPVLDQQICANVLAEVSRLLLP